MKLGGWGSIFDAANAKFPQPNRTATPPPNSGILLNGRNQLQYITLALGSALALFLYPHVLTGALASRSRNVIKRTMVTLSAYSLMLGLFSLLGYVAIAAQTKPIFNAATGRQETNTIIPKLFEQQFPAWFAGIAFAAIGIGALVPAAIMSIAAANLWTRNIYKAYLHPNATAQQETKQAKIASLVVKFGAIAMIVWSDPQHSIDLQLIGGVIILQTLPIIAIALYTRWFHIGGLTAGWAVGLIWGLSMLYNIPNPTTNARNFGGTALELSKLSVLDWKPFPGSTVQIYPGFVALIGNLVIATVLTLVLHQLRVSNGTDQTKAQDYHANEVVPHGPIPSSADDHPERHRSRPGAGGERSPCDRADRPRQSH